MIYSTIGFFRVEHTPRHVKIFKAFFKSKPNVNVKIFQQELRETSFYNPDEIGWYLLRQFPSHGKPLAQLAKHEYWFNGDVYAFVIVPVGSNTYIYVGEKAYTFTIAEKLNRVEDGMAQSESFDVRFTTKPSYKLHDAKQWKALKSAKIDAGFPSLSRKIR